jgi:hypothetical protein
MKSMVRAGIVALAGMVVLPVLGAGIAVTNPSTNATVERAMNLAAGNRRQEAQDLLRTALQQNPQDDSAYQALVKVTQSCELSASSSPFESAQRRLPADFTQLQTPRFILLSDADAVAVNQHGRWVERACEEFERFARDCDLRPLPLQHKLVCVLFEEHEEYQSFARHNDGMNNPAFTGYYSPRHDRVVFSLQSRDDKNTRGKPSKSNTPANDRTLASAGKGVLGFESQASADGLKQNQAGSSCDASCQSANDAGHASAAKCVHETIHQLMFHTRIMSPETQYPLWICEGLSTAFETDFPEQPFGPDHDYEPRRRVFRNMLERGDMIHLRELVGLTSLSGKNA